MAEQFVKKTNFNLNHCPSTFEHQSKVYLGFSYGLLGSKQQKLPTPERLEAFVDLKSIILILVCSQHHQGACHLHLYIIQLQ